MSENPNNETVNLNHDQGKEEKENVREGLLRRGWRMITKICRQSISYFAVAVVAFLAGRNYFLIRSLARYWFTPHSSYAQDYPSSNCGCMPACDIYPDEEVCKAAAKPGGEAIITDLCFAPPGEELATDLSNLPKECSEFGPLGMVSLEDLREGKSKLKPVTEVPASIKPYFEASKGVSVKSALVTFLIVAKAQGESGEELMKDSYLAPMVRDLSLSPDDGLSEDERKTVGLTLGLFNGLVTVSDKVLAEQKALIKLECSRFQDMPLLPVRCIAVNPGISLPFHTWPPNSSGMSL